MVSEPFSSLDAEFRNEVYETLARHESKFDILNNKINQILVEIQALRLQQTRPTNLPPPMLTTTISLLPSPIPPPTQISTATPSNHTMNECHHTHGAISSSCSMATDTEYSYNAPTHSSTNVTPFEVVHGVPSPKLLSYIPCTTKVNAMEELLYDREDIFRNASNVLPQSELVVASWVICKGLCRLKMEILVNCKVLQKKTVFMNVSRLYPCGQG